MTDRVLWLDVAYAADFTCFQAYFDSLRMDRNVGKNIAYDTVRCFTRRLIFLFHDRDSEAGVNVLADSAVHIG